MMDVKIEELLPAAWNPRATKPDEVLLDELAESIKANGLIQPIVVRVVGDDGGTPCVSGGLRIAKGGGQQEAPELQADLCAVLSSGG